MQKETPPGRAALYAVFKVLERLSCWVESQGSRLDGPQPLGLYHPIDDGNGCCRPRSRQPKKVNLKKVSRAHRVKPKTAMFLENGFKTSDPIRRAAQQCEDIV
jgi:hypothetical protein